MHPPRISCLNYFVARLSSLKIITLNLISYYCLPPAYIIKTNPWYLSEGGFRVPLGLGILAYLSRDYRCFIFLNYMKD